MRSILPLAVLFAFVGCGPDMPPPPPPTDSGPPVDSGPDVVDSGPDAGPDFDGGPDFDAGGGDAGPTGMPTCTASAADRHELAIDPAGGDRVIALAANGNSFGVIWNETREGQPDIYATLISGSEPGTKQQVTDQFSRENAPTLVAVGTQWIASWVDNDGGSGFDVRAALLDADLGLSGSVESITSTAMLLEDNPLLHNMSDGPFLTWAEDDMVAGTRLVRARTLNIDGTPRGTTQSGSDATQRPGRTALGELDSGPVALWVEGVGEQNLILQPLTRDGARMGSPSTVSAEGNADGTVDAALFGGSGGAVVFGVLVSGVRREVRFRAFNAAGDMLGSERSLLSPPATGTDASIVPFAGGYAVAYRGDLDDGLGPRIFLQLVDGFGEVLDEITVTSASAAGGRVTLRATGDGQLGIAWADGFATNTEITFQLIRCGS